ncbi:hypothetical protein FPV67DRAFT_1446432 [Lyophyllum atratum]|nr:hypothetical protein FPV67DRAFT_1446432 [Lyophyllum atratum]
MGRTKQTAAQSTEEPAPRKALVVPPSKKPPPSKKRKAPADKETESRRSSQLNPTFEAVEEVDVATSQTLSDDEQFQCPPCYLARQDKDRNVGPYRTQGFANAKEATCLKAMPTTRDAFASCSSPALVILSVHLASVDPTGDSARTVYHNIAPFLPKNDEGFEDYNKKIDELVLRLEEGDLKRFRNFAVYFTDHSNPRCGDLHFTVGCVGVMCVTSVSRIMIKRRLPLNSAPVLVAPDVTGHFEQMSFIVYIPLRGYHLYLGTQLKHLFPPSLTAFFEEGKRNTLTMLVCGAIVTNKDAYEDLKAFADLGHSWIMAFGQKVMQLALTNLLLQAASLSWFIYE